MPRVRKKPIEVEAWPWDGTVDGGVRLVELIRAGGGDAQLVSIPGLTHSICIRTLEGEMHALPGDWVIRGVQGEYYPCKPDIFDQTYELVEQPGAASDPWQESDSGGLCDPAA